MHAKMKDFHGNVKCCIDRIIIIYIAFKSKASYNEIGKLICDDLSSSDLSKQGFMPRLETPTGVSFSFGGKEMAFRIVLVENEVSMKLKLNNLIITKAIEEEIWIPLSDISVIILDNLATTITVRMLTALAEEGVCLVVCGMNHLPCGWTVSKAY